MQSFDIVHCDDPAGFANHAAMAFARGRFFISSYITPKFMSDDDWRIYAGLLRWARANQEILRNTVVLPSRVELGEPYVYAHWLGSRGILAVRNPSNETKEFRIDLNKDRRSTRPFRGPLLHAIPIPQGNRNRPERDSTLSLRLSPWELVFLEIVPLTELHEPVAMGARWFQEPGKAMSIVPDPHTEQVRIFQPGGRERVITAEAQGARRY